MEICVPALRTHPACFGSTCWTTVEACAGSDAEADHARQELCQDYWYPLYAHVRRLGHPTQDAVDLTQAFFADILSRPWFERSDRSLGRFRTFMLTSLVHFLRDRYVQARATRRAGRYHHFSLDAEPALEKGMAVTPLEAYDADWVAAIVAVSLRRLEEEYATEGKTARYHLLKPFLSAEGERERYEATAQQLQTTLANVKTSVHRLRKRYGSILREEVQRTVADPSEVEEEMRYLRRAFLYSRS